jgi:hypothetical protein
MNDVNFSECKFSADMVPYMYDELSSVESMAFEQHLIDCADCTDEFAAISSARYEVYDWKKLEFDPLETPNFEIPFEEVAGVSWSDKIRQMFAHAWAAPTVSFAALAIVAVTAVGVIWLQSGEQLVVKNLEPVPVPVKQNAAPVPDANVEAPSPYAVAVEQPTTQASVSKRAIPRRTGPQIVRATRDRSIEIKQTTARNETRAVPRLNEYPDDEDTSLRLAELLDDIGSR